MAATLEIRFEGLDHAGLAAVTAACEAAAPGAWVVEERRSGFWTAHTTPREVTSTVAVYLTDVAEGRRRLAAIECRLAADPCPPETRPRIVRHDAGEDWSEAWKRAHPPLDIGHRLRVVPAWDETPPPADRLEIRLEPGRAFGLGSHPTTRLALELLETTIRPGDHVADVGVGSGILAVAALHLGAAWVAACDTDPAAVEATRAAADTNGVADRLDVVRGGPEVLTGPFDCVVVNVVAEVLAAMLGDVTAMAPGGRLVLSGLRTDQRPQIAESLARFGFAARHRRETEGFTALVAECPGAE